MRRVSKLDYYIALSNYFYKTKGYVYPAISDKIGDEINIIKQYEGQHGPLSKREVIFRFWMNLLGHAIGLIIYSTLVIYVLREVFDFDIAYTFKNISLLALILIGYKARFRLAKEN